MLERLVSPVLSPMFLHPQDHGVLSADTSPATRAFLLGVAMAVFRIGEFFGSPILGQIVRQIWPKKGSRGRDGHHGNLGNLAIAWSISVDQFWIIVAGQFFLGFVGVSARFSPSRSRTLFNVGSEKSQRFGLIYMASSLAYVFRSSDRWPFCRSELLFLGFLFASILRRRGRLPCYAPRLILWRFPDSAPSKSEVRRRIQLTRVDFWKWERPFSWLLFERC